MTRAHLTIAVVSLCLGASLLSSGPLLARDAGDASHCLGEWDQRLPGTWQIEDRQLGDGKLGDGDRLEATETGSRPGQDGPAEESLRSDCALA